LNCRPDSFFGIILWLIQKYSRNNEVFPIPSARINSVDLAQVSQRIFRKLLYNINLLKIKTSNQLIVIVALFFFGYSPSLTANPAVSISSRGRYLVMTTLLMLILNSVALITISAWRVNRSPQEVIVNAMNRYHGHGVRDGIAPLFKQSTEQSCGAASMAYLLTAYGDRVMEEDMTRFLPIKTNGYSFSDLKKFAQSRGFNAIGYQADFEDLPSNGSPPVVAHLNNGHFIVVIRQEIEWVYYFDSAMGLTYHIDKKAFLEKWSGFILEVTTMERVEESPNMLNQS